MRIQAVALKLIGSFNYDPGYFHAQRSRSGFQEANFFKQNKEYLNQKYYTNWLQSIFWDKSKLKENGLEYLDSNHLRLKDDLAILKQVHTISCKDSEEELSIDFTITAIETLLLRERMGIFFISIRLEEKHFNWRDISLFTSHIRRTSVYHPEEQMPVLVDVIEQYLTPIFHPTKTNWRQFLPQLKSVILVDINQHPGDESLNRLLYDLATFTTPFKTATLNDPENAYFDAQIAGNTLGIFQNWRTLCLEDSLARVAINLVEKDPFKLWENEYVFIYLYVLFARHYMYRCNAKLGEVSSNEKKIRQTRDQYFEFMNEFEFTRISYKFLPNEIFQHIKRSLQIDDEIRVVEKEIDRINTLFKEQSDIRLGRIILGLTILTLFSVAFDLGQLVGKIIDSTSPHEQFLYVMTALSIFLAFGVFAIWVFWWKRR